MERKVISIDLDTGQAVNNANDLDKSVTDLSATFEDIYGEMKPLSGRMGELEDRMYELALAGETNTQEFRDLEKEVGKYKRTIQDVDLAVDAAAQTMGQKLGGSLEFASGGFTAIQGVAATFGAESEALEASILKVQSAMAITQGINAMREGYKSVAVMVSGLGAALAKTAVGQKALNIAQAAGAVGMKVLNAVMNANPVFLLITGITALVGAISYFTSETEKATEASERLNEIQKENLKILSELEKAVKRAGAQELKRLELTGASEKELHEQRLKNLENEERVRKEQFNNEKSFIKGKREAYNLALKEGNDELAKSIREEIEESRKRYKELEDQHKDYINNKEVENLTFQKQQREAEKARLEEEQARYQERLDNYRAYQQKRLTIQNEIEDLRLSLIADGEFKEIEILNINAERKKKSILKDTETSQEEKEQLIRVYELARQAEEQKIRDRYLEKEKELNQKVAEAKFIEPDTPDFAIPTEDAVNPEIEAEIFTQAELRRIRNMAREEEAAANAEFIQEKINQSQGYVDSAMQGLQALDDLNSLLTDKAVKDAGANEAAAEKARKKGFERSKKIQLTMAVIQGVQGVMSAFTAGSSMGPAGVVMGPLMAALAAVTAGINIAKIKATKYEGGGGGGSPSVPTSVPNPASFNIAGDSGTNQIAETLGQANREPTKAYVVSTEVTTAQSLDRNKIETASL